MANASSTWTAVSSSDITNTSSTPVKTATASTRYVVTAITVSNMSATVATRVDILSASTVIWSGPASANGGGFSVKLDGITCPANEALNAQCATTSAQVRVAIEGYSTPG